MTLYYVVEFIGAVKIYQSSKDAQEGMIGCRGATCRVFVRIDDVVSYEKSLHADHITTRPIKRKVDFGLIPTRGHPVSYICYVNKGGRDYYAVSYKLPGEEWKIFTGEIKGCSKGLEQVILISGAIEELFERIEDDEIIIYVKDTRFYILYNKSLPQWERNKWSVKHPPIEYNTMKRFRQKTIKNRFSVRNMSASDEFQLAKLINAV